MPKKKKHRDRNELRLPGLPKVEMLGPIPSDHPKYGKKYVKLIDPEPGPSWDDVVKAIEK